MKFQNICPSLCASLGWVIHFHYLELFETFGVANTHLSLSQGVDKTRHSRWSPSDWITSWGVIKCIVAIFRCCITLFHMRNNNCFKKILRLRFVCNLWVNNNEKKNKPELCQEFRLRRTNVHYENWSIMRTVNLVGLVTKIVQENGCFQNLLSCIALNFYWNILHL